LPVLPLANAVAWFAAAWLWPLPLSTAALAGRMGRVCETVDGLESFSLSERRSR
jgi:hypothetical protein